MGSDAGFEGCAGYGGLISIHAPRMGSDDTIRHVGLIQLISNNQKNKDDLHPLAISQCERTNTP
ncbi:hypothetical protein BBM1094_08465 [Bifidobacterium breve MCC 1094]|nr:hypothetical protein BBM1094_08465 [Bifidobacterium breve MCC 1094]